MLFKTQGINDIVLVSPPNTDLDAGNADEFKRDITPLIEGQQKVIINMESIGFMDSAGLGAILSAFKKVRGGGGLFRIYGLSKEVKALFQLVRMQRLFEIYENRESAIESLQ